MESTTQHWVVIPATGTGQRMKADCPKQYLELSSKSILQHTLDNLLSHPQITGAVLILSSADKYWEKINYRHEKTVLLCSGGAQRHDSVYNGLQRLKQYTDENPYVLIHDAVRPFVTHNDLDRLLDALHENEDGALLAVPVSDTLKLADEHQQVKLTQPRENLWRAFTPQAFRLDKILLALENVIKNNLKVTDDASAMEMLGAHPQLVQGDANNFKITTPDDFLLAKKILNADK